MVKKKKLFEPIRRGAPSLPFDFTEALKKMEVEMRKILTVKELITILLDYNMDALVYINVNGVPTGISLSNVCCSGDDGVTEKESREVIFDIQDEENERMTVASEQFVDPYNGHTYVDLGLPSGTQWATMNVGAEKETDVGLYFAWGETQGYTASQVGTDKEFSWDDYKYGTSSSNLTKYNATDGKTVLDIEDDAAAANMGGDWHMPNRAQCIELFKETKNGFVTNEGAFTQYVWDDNNGYSSPTPTKATIDNWDTAGYFFFKSDVSDMNAAITSGDYLFIPAAGYCGGGRVGGLGFVWASALDSEGVEGAWYFYFYSGRAGVGNSCFRYYGQSVRGVVSLAEKI